MRFEGTYSIGTFFFIGMHEYDPATQTIHIYTPRGNAIRTLAEAVNVVPGRDAGQFVLIYGNDPNAPLDISERNLPPPVMGSTNEAIPASPAGQISITIAPGVSEMQRTRRCDTGDFSPYAGRPVDFSDADLSGVTFGAVDLRQVVLTRTRFSHANLSRCRFGPQQLAGLDLRNVSLVDADLQGFDLTCTRLDGAVLTGANLTGAKLERASLTGANLNNTNFTGVNATGAGFDGAHGMGTRYNGANLTNASFVGARLGNPVFAGATLTGVSFRDAVLPGADFGARERAPGGDANAAADFAGVDFDNADLRSASFSGADLTGCLLPRRPLQFGRSTASGTRFVGATLDARLLGDDWSYIDATDATILTDPSLALPGLKAVHAILPKIGLAGLQLTGADFTSAKLHDARFGRCALQDATFDQAELPGADFTAANLEGANFTSADLRSCVFAQAWLFNVTFTRTVLMDTNFSSAMLAQSNFSAIQGRSLAGVNFARACLVSADFHDVDAPRAGSTRTTFSGACLAGADFSNASLFDVMLTDAQLSSGSGEITVVHPARPNGRRFRYQSTTLSPDITGDDTTCPDGRGGACSTERLTSRPVPERWSP